MFFIERRPSHRESNKGSKERRGQTISVRFTEMSISLGCPLRESRRNYNICFVCFVSFLFSFDYVKFFFARRWVGWLATQVGGVVLESSVFSWKWLFHPIQCQRSPSTDGCEILVFSVYWCLSVSWKEWQVHELVERLPDNKILVNCSGLLNLCS